MARKKRLKVSADFETTVDPEDCRVWAGCAVDIETLETVHLSNSIESFFEWLQDKNTVCYFHNLKFDGEFILAYLLRNGFKYSQKPKDKTFSALITDGGVWYSLTVIFKKEKKHYKKVVFYDSLKKLPFKVATIAKAFNLPDEKLVIDYKAPRAVGHVLTEEEKQYIVNDCRIVANALQIQFGQGLKKMTNASDALSYFKKGQLMEKYFERFFPTFPVELDSFIRKAYKGGYVYLNPKHKNRRGLKGITFDVNSLYPSVMYNSLLPYGYPVYFEGEPETTDDYPLFIVHLKCRFNVKKDHLPTIQLKNNRAYVETEYLTTSRVKLGNVVIDEPVDLTLTNVDLDLFLDHYDVEDLVYIKGLKFRGRDDFFREYIDYWMKVKETSTGAIRQLAKLMLNSLYGKFATNPRADVKIPVFDDDGEIVRYEVLTEKNAERLGCDAPELRDPVYTAMGAFITAYAREKTIRSGQAVYDRFIYADTDSLHLIGHDVPEGIDVHATRLGAWKNEGIFHDSKFIRAKTYMETTDEGTKVTCAGMPDNVKEKVTYDNFKSGSTFDGKLMPKRVKGGVVLVETTFTIK